MASILHSLAADNVLEVHLALVSKNEAGSADGYDGSWDMMEVLDEHYSISDWIKMDGSPAGFRMLDVGFSPKEILQVTGHCRLYF